MITCRELTELVTDYVEGRMTLWERIRFNLHIGMCTHCREYVRQMQVTRSVLGAMPPVKPPDDVMADLMERFEHWKREPLCDGTDPES